MAWLQNGTVKDTGSSGSTTWTLTVPAGIVSSNFVALHVAGSITSPTTCVASKSGATFTVMQALVTTTNQWSTIIKGTGLVAGDTITLTFTGTSPVGVAGHYYFDTDFDVIGSNGVKSGTTEVAPAITVAAGTKVHVFMTTRGASSALSSVVNSNGRTITDRQSAYLGTGNITAIYMGEFVESGTTTGTTTGTWTVSNTNGLAIHISELSSVPAASGTASLTLSGSGAIGTNATASLSLSASGSTGSTASGSATLSLAASGSATPPSLTSAVAGGVGTTTAKVRIDAANATSAVVTAATNTGLSTGVVTSSSVTLDGDGLGIATLTGLVAGTDYYFGVALNGAAQSARGNFRTAQTSAYSFSFAAASCMASGADPTDLDSIRTRTGPAGKTAEFFAHLGDMHYYGRNTSSTSTILTDWRSVQAATRHKALFAAMPVEYTWSDHDLGPDQCDSVVLGSAVIAAERATFDRYFPTYDLPGVNTDGAPYRSWVRGRVRFVMTDGRTYMSAIAATDNSSKTKLGATQLAWLLAEFDAAKAAGQAIVWFHEDGGWTSATTFVNDDSWAAYTNERGIIASHITGAGMASRVLLVHGDYHAMAADNGTNSAGGIPVALASPLQQSYFIPSQAAWSVAHYPATDPGTALNQYGWFDVVDTGGTTLTVNFTGYSNDSTGGTSGDTSRVTLSATLDTFIPGFASLTLTASGAPTAKASGTASLSLSGSGSAKASVSATAALTLSASGTAQQPGASATAALSLTTSGVGRAPATASAALILAATASTTSPGSGSAAISLTGSGNTSGSSPASGAAALTLAAVGSPSAAASSAAALALSAASAARAQLSALGVLSLQASGTVGSRASGAATLSLSAFSRSGGNTIQLSAPSRRARLTAPSLERTLAAPGVRRTLTAPKGT